ncbi:DUF4062 domain-containing protein [Photobacterium aquae]|uniref:DUF4062 domain-containing protein n=1 Tax=Photobacterium aquae TaxID=1195763 RepID=UPI00069EAC68|nr:DUF4062 domain-containing protein [Photobacterium aquae]
MATPRVFISSTCYDLKHIRESIKYFVRSIGYEPVLSDDGDVFYNPQVHTHDSCLNEVATCQLFVLIVGGRYGGVYKDSTDSITNEEYRAAVSHKIPIFTLIDQAVFADHHLYQSNKNNDKVDRDNIKYPASDNIKIFDFINEVRLNSLNNAIQPFKNYLDIESYLKKQWAGMMFDFLLKVKHQEQQIITNKLLADLATASKKTEELVKFVYEKVDDTNNAQNVIDSVSMKVEAQEFVDGIKEMFNISYLQTTNLERLLSTSMNQSWSNYLIEAADFKLSYEEDTREKTIDTVLWGPNSGRGYVLDDSVLMQKSLATKFLSLSKLPNEDKRSILDSFITPIL